MPVFLFQFRPYFVWLMAGGLWLLSAATWAQAQDPAPGAQSLTVVKSENDKRNYRYLVLANQLRVLLISDPATEKSAAALNVQVGANQNPANRAGMAHFLEHMLFLGTQKYPQAGEYQAFIAQHGGRFNAYTAAENTNYFFEINNAQLAPALDRFAQFFIAPLFSAQYVERERNAVHSEYMAKLKDDARREWDVYREVMNPHHPGALFSVGNHTTLADREGALVRDDMIAFYEQYYSSHLMGLVVLGVEPLDELEAIVRAQFSSIAKRDVAIESRYPSLFAANSLPATLEIKPEKELRQLIFNFPIPNPERFYRHKPYHYIAHHLGHEGRGSLLSLLKRLGWAEGIYAGTVMHSRSDALFQLRIQLTSQGVIARDQIASLVFHTIEQLKSRGISAGRYTELQQLADLDFHYQEKQAPMDTVSSFAQELGKYQPRDILRGDFLYTEFDSHLISRSLSYLNTNNLLLVLIAPDIQPYRLSKLYSVPYSLRRQVPEVFELKPGVRQELYLPEKNLFIPKRLHVKASSMLEQPESDIESQPTVIHRSNKMQVWFAQDRAFRQPRAHINLRIESPLVAGGAEGAAQAQLFAALIEDQLNEFAYPAKLAGVNYKFTATARGYDLLLSGYSARQGMLMNEIISAVSSARFNEERFNLLKKELLRTWRNKNKDLPYLVLAEQIPALHLSPSWSTAELIEALNGKTFDQFNQFSSRQLIDTKAEALFYGNYFRAEALKLAVIVEHELLSRRAGRQLDPAHLLALPENNQKAWYYTYPLSHQDKVVELFIQSPSRSVQDVAQMMLIRQVLQPEFYHQLRTQQQLGYVVGILPLALTGVENSLFVVQSPTASAAQIQQQIEQFLEQQLPRLSDEFVDNQAALIKKLREPARSLSEQATRYWEAIVEFEGHFERRSELAHAVAEITPDMLEEFYVRVYLNPARRLWLSSEAPAQTNSVELLQDISTYKQNLQQITLH